MRIARIAFAIAACIPAFGQTLTTIQDTLFKADGTRFNGSLTIRWTTFDAANLGTVVQQSRTVSVVNGNLQLQLAPNANANAPSNIYTVAYQSDGRNQFTETWTVPTSSIPLKVAAIRTGTLASGGSGSGTGSGAQTPVLESDVVGLMNDLDQRPVKGSAFGTGRVAVINQNGEVETAVGDVADCMRVDGTSGACGSPVPAFVDAETPGGVVDGSNTTFTLAYAPSGKAMQLFRNGLYMTPGFDYTLTGNTFAFIAANVPVAGDTLTASYRIDPAGALTAGALTAPASPSVQVLCSATGTSSLSTTYTSLGSCTVPLSKLHPGDRIELQFTLTHAGTASQFDLKTLVGSTAVIQRHATTQDSAIAGRVSGAVTGSGLLVSTESYGSLLPLLPSIQTLAAPGAAVKIDIQAQLAKSGTSDRITLQSYTVLRYPAN